MLPSIIVSFSQIHIRNLWFILKPHGVVVIAYDETNTSIDIILFDTKLSPLISERNKKGYESYACFLILCLFYMYKSLGRLSQQQTTTEPYIYIHNNINIWKESWFANDKEDWIFSSTRKTTTEFTQKYQLVLYMFILEKQKNSFVVFL